MTLFFVLSNDTVFDLLRVLLIIKTKQHKTKPSASLRQFLSHDNCVFYFSELFEVAVEVMLTCLEGESTHKKLNLVLFCGLVERGSGAVTTLTTLRATHVPARGHPTRICLIERWHQGHH